MVPLGEQIGFILCHDPAESMKLISGHGPALLLIVLIAGCTSYITVPSVIVTQTPGPEVQQSAETSLTATTLPATAPTSPGLMSQLISRKMAFSFLIQ